MTESIRHRLINERVVFDDDELAERLRLCSEFRDEMNIYGIHPKMFGELLGVSPVSAYRWVSLSKHSCPAPIHARRFLWLLSHCEGLHEAALLCPIRYRGEVKIEPRIEANA